MVIAEIELESEAQAFVQPAWLGEEVTDDARYFNSSLTEHPYATWPAQKGKHPKVSVHGTGNAAVVGHHNQVTINVTRSKVVAEVRPGKDHITDDQATRLQQLVRDVHERTGKEFQRVWSALLRHMRAPQYRLIRLERFPEAEAYLVQWLARTTPPDETLEQLRKRHIRYIKTNQRKLGRPDADVTQFLQEHFGKDGLRACNVEELALVRARLVERWRHTF